MARAAAKPKKEISMEEALWKSADKLRGSVEPAEYKHVVLSLFFLKFASDKFEAQRKKLIAAGYEAQIEKTFAYTKDNVFYLPPESRWSYIMENAKQDDIALKIDTALYTIEKTNPALKGALQRLLDNVTNHTSPSTYVAAFTCGSVSDIVWTELGFCVSKLMN